MNLAERGELPAVAAIVLIFPDRRWTLTAAEGRRVLDRFEEVANEVGKWSRSTQRPGRLLLIDRRLAAEIEHFLVREDPS